MEEILIYNSYLYSCTCRVEQAASVENSCRPTSSHAADWNNSTEKEHLRTVFEVNSRNSECHTFPSTTEFRV